MYRLMLFAFVFGCFHTSVTAAPHSKIQKRFKKRAARKKALEVPPMPQTKPAAPIKTQPKPSKPVYTQIPRPTALDQAIASQASKKRLSLKRKKKRRAAASLNFEKVS